MSQENVDNARRAYATLNEAYRQGDASLFLPILEEMWAPDAVFEPAGVLPDHSPRPHRGWDGVLHLLGNQMEAFSEGWFEADEFIDRGDYLVVPIRFGGRARHTGLPVEFSMVQLFTFRDGKVTRCEVHKTVAEAFKAAGLSEQAVSQENVDTFREAVEAFNSGDMEDALARVHPEVEWTSRAADPDPRTCRGQDGVRQFFTTWLDAFEGFRLHLERCDTAGDDLVVAALRVSGEGTGSRVPVESPTFFQVVEFQDGQILRARMFSTEDEAIQAAGLRE
ncbi:MAG: nuclear transport factor 2 family protein [Solirubrobacterales bacterium]